jgi:hypothetical protein
VADLLLVGAIAVIGWWALQPPKPGGPKVTDPSADTRTPTSGAQPAGPLDPYVALAQRDYRKPLYDPVVKKEVAPPKPKPKFPGELTGTVLEPGFSYATFRVRGRDELVQVGQPIGQTGARLLSVAEGSARIDWAQDEITLQVGGGS